jgi:hypothetical protein
MGRGEEEDGRLLAVFAHWTKEYVMIRFRPALDRSRIAPSLALSVRSRAT